MRSFPFTFDLAPSIQPCVRRKGGNGLLLLGIDSYNIH
jgi:hypothetical protein